MCFRNNLFTEDKHMAPAEKPIATGKIGVKTVTIEIPRKPPTGSIKPVNVVMSTAFHSWQRMTKTGQTDAFKIRFTQCFLENRQSILRKKACG